MGFEVSKFEVSEFKINNVKFIYSEKATKFCEIFPLLLSYGVPVKSKGKISQNFVAFSEYMNFTKRIQKKDVIYSEKLIRAASF